MNQRCYLISQFKGLHRLDFLFLFSLLAWDIIRASVTLGSANIVCVPWIHYCSNQNGAK